MSDEALVAAFEERRGHMTAVAYRMLGSHTDAEDAVQETWLRLVRQDTDAIDNFSGWLTTVVGRICIDMLRSRRARPEPVHDERLPDFVVTEDDDSPEETALLAESIGLALLVVLESLRPDERLALVLHDMFAVSFADIAGIIGKSPDAAKMLASRARAKVRAAPRPTGDQQEQRGVVDAFLAAGRDGDFESLLGILDPELVWRSYMPGGRVTKLGMTDVVEAVERGRYTGVVARRVSVNGEPGILSYSARGRPVSVMACTVVDGRMANVVALVDPARLAAMDLPAARAAGSDEGGT